MSDKKLGKPSFRVKDSLNELLVSVAQCDIDCKYSKMNDWAIAESAVTKRNRPTSLQPCKALRHGGCKVRLLVGTVPLRQET